MTDIPAASIASSTRVTWEKSNAPSCGSLATAAWKAMDDPVLVERVSADAGIDIGRTLIGMHLRRVAVPIRLAQDHVGEAAVTAARTRPPLIGGERAKYTEED